MVILREPHCICKGPWLSVLTIDSHVADQAFAFLDFILFGRRRRYADVDIVTGLSPSFKTVCYGKSRICRFPSVLLSSHDDTLKLISNCLQGTLFPSAHISFALSDLALIAFST